MIRAIKEYLTKKTAKEFANCFVDEMYKKVSSKTLDKIMDMKSLDELPEPEDSAQDDSTVFDAKYVCGSGKYFEYDEP